jgi:hypothetical protein
MKRVLGPVLGFRGSQGNTWSLSVLVVYDGAAKDPKLSFRAVGAKTWKDVAGVLLKSLGARRVLRFSFDVPRGAATEEWEYALAGEGWRFHVPAKGAHPRMAFATCNGFSDPRDMRDVSDKNERWSHMARVHSGAPLHLLLLGGDQIYADSIWSVVSSIKEWNELPTAERVKRSFTAQMSRQVETFYFDLYCERWSQSEVAAMWASVPTLMTWDDHDIFDGWGSYDTDLQGCDVYKGIFECAREHFRLFQLQLAPGEPPAGGLPQQDGLTFGHRIGEVAVLFLDTRSERTRTTILSLRSWDALFAWVDGLGSGAGRPRHLLIVTPVPVLYPALRVVEWAAGLDPRHEQKRLEDDLRDHWTSPGHASERKRLIQRLLAFSNASQCRVTLLSGDVHVAALGVLESSRHPNGTNNANVINQLVSSPVVHVPPGGLVRWALEKTAEGDEEVERGVHSRMVDVPGRKRRIVNLRNWLEIDVEPDLRLWANWHFEGETEPSTKVVHAVG